MVLTHLPWLYLARPVRPSRLSAGRRSARLDNTLSIRDHERLEAGGLTPRAVARGERKGPHCSSSPFFLGWFGDVFFFFVASSWLEAVLGSVWPSGSLS